MDYDRWKTTEPVYIIDEDDEWSWMLARLSNEYELTELEIDNLADGLKNFTEAALIKAIEEYIA